jgi:hypothetical protein
MVRKKDQNQQMKQAWRCEYSNEYISKTQKLSARCIPYELKVFFKKTKMRSLMIFVWLVPQYHFIGFSQGLHKKKAVLQ